MDKDIIFDIDKIPLSLLDEAYIDYEELYEKSDINQPEDGYVNDVLKK